MYTYNDSIVSLTNQNRINQGIDVNNGVYQQHILFFRLKYITDLQSKKKIYPLKVKYENCSYFGIMINVHHSCKVDFDN